MRLIYERAYFIGNAFSTAAYFRKRLIFESGLITRGYGIQFWRFLTKQRNLISGQKKLADWHSLGR